MSLYQNPLSVFLKHSLMLNYSVAVEEIKVNKNVRLRDLEAILFKIIAQNHQKMAQNCIFQQKFGLQIVFSNHPYNSQSMRNKQESSDQSYSSQQNQEQEIYSDSPMKSEEFRHKSRRRWTPEQNIRYAEFLKEHIEMVKSPKLRKKHHMYCMISKHMGSRSADQAKSHHQKMIRRHKQEQKIIEYIEARFVLKIRLKPKIQQIKVQSLSKTSQIEENMDVKTQQKSIIPAHIYPEGPQHIYFKQERSDSPSWFDDV